MPPLSWQIFLICMLFSERQPESNSYKTITLWFAGAAVTCSSDHWNIFHQDVRYLKTSKTVTDAHTSHSSTSQNTNLSYTNDTLEWWAKHREGWERLVNWQTFLLADVNVISQNMLNMMLQTKIWTCWTMWELICLDEGGPQLADLEVRIITPWGRNSSGLVQGEPHKGERWTRMPLFPDSGSNASQMTGSRARWPQDRIPDILPSDSDVLVSLRRTDVLFTTCVAEREGGSVRDRTGGIFWYHCSFPLPDLLWFELWWITPYESLWSSSI